MFANLSIGSILKIVEKLLKVANKIAKYIERKQLIDAGKAIQQKENVREAKDAVSKAIDIRRNTRRKFKSDGMPDNYKYYRD